MRYNTGDQGPNRRFCRESRLTGERDESLITRYLNEIMVKYDTFTAFFVSEKTRIYYQARGILKRVEEQVERDVWFFRVRQMREAYELNVDPDLANLDALTIFINHRVLDYQGNFIGVAGVGLTINFVNQMIAQYGDKYHRDIFFVDQQGEVVLLSDGRQQGPQNIRRMPEFAGRALTALIVNLLISFGIPPERQKERISNQSFKASPWSPRMLKPLSSSFFRNASSFSA